MIRIERSPYSGKPVFGGGQVAIPAGGRPGQEVAAQASPAGFVPNLFHMGRHIIRTTLAKQQAAPGKRDSDLWNERLLDGVILLAESKRRFGKL